jgi:D-alanyl-D-alanine carboxypeptidase (penicillin-binding protein 5/6)
MERRKLMSSRQNNRPTPYEMHELDRGSPMNLLWGMILVILSFLLIVVCILSIDIFSDATDNPIEDSSQHQGEPDPDHTSTPDPGPAEPGHDDNPVNPDPGVPTPGPGPELTPPPKGYVIMTTPQTVTLDPNLLDSNYAVLVDVEERTIVAGYDYDVKMYPASMTKIMTLLVACERLNEAQMSDHVILAQDVVAQMQAEGASGVGFSAGDELTVKDLLYAVALESDGIASMMLARYVAGSEQAFVQMMNDKAVELGLISTSFRNPTGLHHDEHVTTCREMASIMIAAMDNEMVKTLLSTPSYKTTTKVYPRGLTFYSSYFVDVVEELRQIGYETSPSNGSVLAAKTGYTLEARYCLATLFVNKFEDKTYVAVTGHTVGMHLSCVRDYIRLYEDYTK